PYARLSRSARGHRSRHPARPRLRAVRRPAVGRDGHARHRAGARVRRGRARRVPGQDARLQLLAQLQLVGGARRPPDRVVPGRAGRTRLPLPVHHPRRDPRAQPHDVRARPPLRRHRDDRVRRAAERRVRLGGRRLHRYAPPARGRHGLLRLRLAGPQPRRLDARARDVDRGAAVPLILPSRQETPMTLIGAPTPTTTPPERTYPGIDITGPMHERFEQILTPEALAFLAQLHELFAGPRYDRPAARLRHGYEIGNGHDPRFREDTRRIRERRDWRVAGAGPGLEDRRVEITGPADPRMTANALNSDAKVWLADLEDATSPTARNVIRGQLDHTAANGRRYTVTNEAPPTIVMRPRGWHLEEHHLEFTDRHGRTMAPSASLVDFGLYAFHNAHELVRRGRGPYFYLPKIEQAEEARLWDQVFAFTEQFLDLPHGTIRATVLIETLPA